MGGVNKGDINQRFGLPEVDESPAQREKAEWFFEPLMQTLDELSIKDIGEAKQQIVEARKYADDKKNLQLDNLEEVINMIASLKDKKTEQDRREKINALAKTSVYKIADAKNLRHYAGYLDVIIHQLEKVVYNIAQADFPEDWKRQQEYRDQDQADEIREMIDKTKGIVVS